MRHIGDPKMGKAYRAARELLGAELSNDERQILGKLDARDVVVVKGAYDRVEDVLSLAGIPHRVVRAAEIAHSELTPLQMVIINCPGKIGANGVSNIRSFVNNGGSLVTTDWALREVLQQAFPGYVEYNRVSTADTVVPIEVNNGSSPWLAGMFHDGADPVWWLEGSSYPIKILDSERVEVLLKSSELGERYGESAVAVSFQFGKGDVLHMISHYYLQRAELRTARHRRNWKSYASEVGAEAVASNASSEFDDLFVGEVEAAHKSLRFVTNMVLESKRKQGRC